MRIKKILSKRSGITLILDGGEPVVLNKDVFNKSGIFVGLEISDNELLKLQKMSALIDIKTKAFQLLARRSHSVREMKLKLIKRKYNQDLIDEILSDLVANGYLNDKKFAQLFAEEKIVKRRQSLNKVKSELINKGITKDILNGILAHYQDSEIFLDSIKDLVEKKSLFLKQKYSDEDLIKQKLFAYLFRKGFETDQINKVLN